MDLIDSTFDLASGNVKDDCCQARKIVPIIAQLDPEKKLLDLVAYGATNFQKAGRINMGKFQKGKVFKRWNIMDLFSKYFKDPCRQLLKPFTKNVKCLALFEVHLISSLTVFFHFHDYHEQGAEHLCSNPHTKHSNFKKVVLEHNNGGPIGFVKAAKLWFGGQCCPSSPQNEIILILK